MISAVIIVIGAWLLCGVVLAGLGQLIRERFGLAVGGWFDSFWLGYAAAIGILQVWQLVAPITWRTTLIIGLIGLIGFVRALTQLPHQVRRGDLFRFVLVFVLTIPLALWVASRALDSQLDFDSGFYHLSAIRWLNAYPVVPGIGNLHYRLAFNQTFFLFCAALNLSPLTNLGFHIANSLLLMALTVGLLSRLITAMGGVFRGRLRPDQMAGGLFLPALIYHVIYQRISANISSPSPDLSVFILQAVVELALIRFIFPTSDQDQRSEGFQLFLIMVLSAVGVTSKLSFAAFGAAVVLVAGAVWLWRNRSNWRPASRILTLVTLIVAALIGLPWVMRGAITSGYPFFPSRIGALPVDFRVPEPITREAELWVYSFARQPNGDMDTVLSNWDWVPGWWARLTDPLDVYLFLLPLQIGLGALLLVGVALLVRLVLRRKIRLGFGLPLIPILVGALFWFVSAPDPRFAGSVFWLLAAWGVTWCCFVLMRWLGLLLLLIVSLGASAWIVSLGYQDGVTLADRSFPDVPTAQIQTYHTESGLEINISGNPNDTLELWDAPLPASPYKLPGLQLRGATLRDGFRLPPDATLTPP